MRGSGSTLVSVTVDYEPADVLLGNEPRVSVLVGIPGTRRPRPTSPGGGTTP